MTNTEKHYGTFDKDTGWSLPPQKIYEKAALKAREIRTMTNGINITPIHPYRRQARGDHEWYAYTCGICGRLVAFLGDTPQAEWIWANWHPMVWRGDELLDSVCERHAITEDDDGEYILSEGR